MDLILAHGNIRAEVRRLGAAATSTNAPVPTDDGGRRAHLDGFAVEVVRAHSGCVRLCESAAEFGSVQALLGPQHVQDQNPLPLDPVDDPARRFDELPVA